MKRLAFLLTVSAVLAAAAPAHAAVTVGVADLDAWTPNVPVGCSALPMFLVGTGQQSCTYFTTAVGMFTPDGTNQVPKGFGVITKIRVKTANVPQGPMQVVTFRSIRQTNSTGDPGCCTPVHATPPFTPNAGGITEIATRLPVMNATLLSQYMDSGDLTYAPSPDAPPPWTAVREAPAGTQGIENYDAIALTVLDGTTPIPATTTGDVYNGPAGAAFFPALSTRTMRVDLVALNSLQVLLQGVWEPDADRDGLGDETQDPDGGHPTTGGGTAPGMTIGTGTNTNVVTPPPPPVTMPGTARLVGTRSAQVPVRCTSGAVCSGVLRLVARATAPAKARAAAAKARKPALYGSARFTIAHGATKTVTVRLTAAAKHALRGRRTLPVTATATIAGRVVTKKLTLRRRR